MRKIKKNPSKNPAQDVTFDVPTIAQKKAIEMLISLNLSKKTVITGPEVDIDLKILVTKVKPFFFFNPTIEPESLNDGEKSSIIVIQYKTYIGNSKTHSMKDPGKKIRKAVNYLNNGIPEKAKKKTTKES